MSIYKGNKLIADKSVGTHLVRKPAWSQAVAISSKELAAGYKAPADGMIVGSVIPAPGVSNLKLFCNGVLLSLGTNNPSGHWSSYIQSHTIVNAGDVISITPNVNSGSSELSFVPFIDSYTGN